MAKPHAHVRFSEEFDASAPIRFTGTVTQVKWMNPHASFCLDVKDDAGKTVNWRFEMVSWSSLTHQGWTRSSMMVGDIVTVVGWRAKDGTNFGNARSVTINTRRRLLAALSPGTKPRMLNGLEVTLWRVGCVDQMSNFCTACCRDLADLN